MSDVVAVALVSAGSSLVGAAVGAVTTYKVSLRNSQTTVTTTKAQKEVELAKIEAESMRLLQQHGEEERRNRQSTYHRTVTVLQRIYGIRPDSEDKLEVWAEWRYCRSGVQIFGSKRASEALDQVQDVIHQKPPLDENRSSWQEEFRDTVYVFIEAVRDDIKNDERRPSPSDG